MHFRFTRRIGWGALALLAVTAGILAFLLFTTALEKNAENWARGFLVLVIALALVAAWITRPKVVGRAKISSPAARQQLFAFLVLALFSTFSFAADVLSMVEPSVQGTVSRTEKKVDGIANDFQKGRAMEFIRASGAPELSQIRARLAEPWESVDLAQLVLETPENIDRVKAEITRQVKDDDLEALTEFYRGVLLCRASDACDHKLIDGYFKADISDFYCSYNFRLRVISQRLNRSDYADLLKIYVGDCG